MRALLAERSETGVIFEKEGQSKSLLKPRTQVKAGRVVEFIVRSQHPLFTRADNAAKAQHDTRTISAIDGSTPKQFRYGLFQRRQQGSEAGCTVRGQALAGENGVSPHDCAGSV